MPLIPVICLYIGITLVGWSLAAEESVRLDNASALQLCSQLYLTMVLGIALMGGFVRWMSPTFMRVRKEDGLLYAASVWGVGLLVLVTLLVEMILLWSNYLSPEYLRPLSPG